MTQNRDAATALVEVDEDVCIGAGNCVFAAPTVFAQREDDGIVMLLQPNPPPDALEAVRKAVRVCPARAIRLKADGA